MSNAAANRHFSPSPAGIVPEVSLPELLMRTAQSAAIPLLVATAVSHIDAPPNHLGTTVNWTLMWRRSIALVSGVDPP
ncbi:hypothetical protein Mkiyose1088_44780 [Mycobacterium kiyosense]|uniref:Uncharacterized protein n=1 Tax=Mycobacterium kiyosense TaxID=2871094 RepID=A0A9P3QDJ3_9MYCO|nr:hypothetical protein IWGMT90018_17190 [Mycobacterium kiyosense]GLB95128.1 hypothetical protein SRL2020226_19040 [Mycobacterium kiyosense]GLC02410.1 hypothetical protein SRL2020400_30010 [Mycobacterium kiyosense]GLD02612.1 hypothetical protein Mkiyose1088_44780 [Mycobacterium kiyosense]GLD17194.1 hypothetical protein Mkiyose1385_12930 [Mycobacterium kiyosense]